MQGAAIASADYGDSSWRGMNEQGWMTHHLVIQKVLSTAQHGEAIDHH